MIVKRFAAPTLHLHDPGADLGVGQRPIDDPVLKQLVEKPAESTCKIVAAPSGSKTADAIQDFPNRN